MVKPNNQIKIDFIIACLKKGEERGNILVKAGKKWGTSKSAFDRMLRIAKDQYGKKADLIKKELEVVELAAAIETRKKAIISEDERKELLTSIAKGEVEIPTKEAKWDSKQGKFVILSKIELSSHSARISAIAELNKMEGVYFADKNPTSPITININGKPPNAGN